ncbi:hypothetical protein ACFQ1E_04290 [Sphingomonas canadensis]|uniref:HTH marR-type domain-containing protein n=1 Tax=Sphingomonas canadensis TaxID=1219257 RepID=A0ABW3H2Z9_9SPHN|nr:hypothetical protein [Sphingomonas canadensis]MCW3834536.1 hypothetical protein [Sphingomonas canadensis]
MGIKVGPNANADPYQADYARQGSALVVAESDGDAHEAVAALEAAGIRTCRRIGFAEAAAGLERQYAMDLLLIEGEAAPDALLDLVLPQADTVARERQLGLVATVSPEQIDIAATHLLGGEALMLCRPTQGDRAAAVAVARMRAAQRRHFRVRSPARAVPEPDGSPLQRLSEEMARLAEELARLSRGDEQGNGAMPLREPDGGYRGPDEDRPEATAAEIRAVIRARRMRSQFFRGDLFADPAWDMLLDLFAAHLERRRVSVSSLCIAAAVPPTTALRWIGTLHDARLFERQADPSDRRRAYIALSPMGLDGMRGYAAAVKRAGLAIV